MVPREGSAAVSDAVHSSPRHASCLYSGEHTMEAKNVAITAGIGGS